MDGRVVSSDVVRGDLITIFHWEHAMEQWLRHCATNRKVA
jgi:hypothetical protein